MGITTAYYLTRSPSYDPETHSIILLEAVGVAAGSSGKGGGFVASWAVPACIAPLSFKLHRALAREHDGEKVWGYRAVYAAEVELQAGEEPEGEHVGGDDDREKETDHYSENNEDRSSPSALDWLRPGSMKACHEIGTPADSGQVHPYLFCHKMAELARMGGASIIIGTVTSINYFDHDDSSGSGSSPSKAIKSVTYSTTATTSQGETKIQTHDLPATDVLLAAGPWTSKLLPRVKLLAPKGHSIVVRPSSGGDHTIGNISPYILFPTIISSPTTTTPILSPDIYPRPRDALNTFDAIYASGPDYHDVPLPDLVSEVTVEEDKADSVWRAVRSVSSRAIQDGAVITKQACHKAQIRKHEEDEEVGPIVGPVDDDDVVGLWLATGLDEWGGCPERACGRARHERDDFGGEGYEC